MAGDEAVDEAMETEILPSTSNSNTKIKEKDNKSQNLPWYVLSSQKKVLFLIIVLYYCENLGYL